MIVDIFKNKQFFNNNRLKVGNKIIRQACSKFTFAYEGQEYDLDNGKVSYWFDPNYLKELHLSHNYPKKSYEVTKNPKFQLILYFPNYISLYLINLIYKKRKDIIIEDQAAGMGRFVIYLKRLGFNNFHIIENFTQLCPELLEETMKLAKIKYTLNDFSQNPQVINLVGWTHLLRESIPSNTELICIYNNTNLVIEKKKNKYYIMGANGHFPMTNFTFLCRDVDRLINVFCRNDKHYEFKKIIKFANLTPHISGGVTWL